MERKIPANKTNSYTTIQDYFLAHWVNTIGLGPAILYLELLSYCHKGKDTAWPSIKTLNKRMGTTTKTLIRYRNTLIEYGLIKKVVKQKSSSGGYDHNLYQIVLLDKDRILLPPVERLPEDKEEIISGIEEEAPSSNPNNPQKERIKEELKKLNLDKKSIDKIILNYSLEDMEEKLELLQIKRKVVNPAGWLITALKEDYATLEAYEKPEELIPPVKQKEEIKRLPREEELKWIRKIREIISK
jgi:predicted transcriptional regulator